MAETLEAVHTSPNAEQLAYRSSQAVQSSALGGVFIWETTSCAASSVLRDTTRSIP
jgi:hypothetical protein